MDASSLITKIRDIDNFSISLNKVDNIEFNTENILDSMIVLYQCCKKNIIDNFFVSVNILKDYNKEITLDNIKYIISDNLINIKKFDSNIKFNDKIKQIFNYNNYNFYHYEDLVFLYYEEKIEVVEFYSVLKYFQGRYLGVVLNGFDIEEIRDYYGTMEEDFFIGEFNYKIIKQKHSFEIKE